MIGKESYRVMMPSKTHGDTRSCTQGLETSVLDIGSVAILTVILRVFVF